VSVTVPTSQYFVEQVPCRAACPVGTDARGYVQAVARNDLATAYRIARLPNPLASVCGRICAAPCESHCRRGSLDGAVTIRGIKRVACVIHGPESGTDLDLKTLYPDAPCRTIYPDKMVAVIGAGPAGLACAHELGRWGARVTVFEMRDKAGGMLRYGVPAYRLPREVLDADIRQIERLGVEFRFGMALGRDMTLTSLRAEGYQAVFLGIGAQQARHLPLEGNELDGVVYAVDYLLNLHQGYQLNLGERVVVIGGGNVAFDVARSVLREPAEAAITVGKDAQGGGELQAALDVARAARRGGAPDVDLYCLESRAEMPADDDEIAAAREEGIRIHPGWGPGRILGEKGHVTGIRLRAVERVFDEAGRFSPTFKDGVEQEVAATGIVLAVGQQVDASSFGSGDEGIVGPRGTIGVDAETLETTIPGVYSGGDAAFGPRIAIAAVAEGKRAASSIAARLSIPTDERPAHVESAVKLHYAPRPGYDRAPRRPPPTREVQRRIGPTEVELTFEPPAAVEQACRCLGCHVHPVFDGSRCVLCGGCADVCPERCLSFVPVARLSAQIPNLPGATALLMDERLCIRCGLCAVRCPAEAIAMEAFELCR